MRKTGLAHLLFQIGGSGAREHAAIAVDAYVESASRWGRLADTVEDLRSASRIARAINDEERLHESLGKLLDATELTLEQEPPLPGVALRALNHAISDAVCPQRVDGVLELAAQKLPRPEDRDDAFALMLRRCADEQCKKLIWERRVNAYIASADDADTGILRAVIRRDALKIAEQSGDSVLKERAAAALQAARDEDLGLIHVSTSSEHYDELFEQYRDSFIAGDRWTAALVAFANAGPLNGNVEQTKRGLDELRAVAPMAFLFPVKLMGPDNLPYWEPANDEERYEYDLIKLEVTFIAGHLPPLTSALHEIPIRFGVPTVAELAQFLREWPGMHESVLPAMVYALQRFWAGDSEGVIYTLVPRIETLVRELLLSIDYGMYALQQARRPGQFPALGPMLDTLAGRFTITETRLRLLKAVLTEPPGFNIRNSLAHGMDQYNHPGLAALLIHTALYICTLQPVPDPEEAAEQRRAP
jgi:hypothetical protein